MSENNVIVHFSNESGIAFEFDAKQTARQVILAVLKTEGCPFSAEVTVQITDGETMRAINRQMRGVDRETDVLSFPGLDFQFPSDFEHVSLNMADCMDPETGNVLLGDILILANRVFEQAEEYGHSSRREFAFLVAHSMYHLCGYDHIDDKDAKLMEEKQRHILNILHISRDSE